MELNTINHALICLENRSYNRRVLLRGAQLARRNNYTFEVLFFYSPKNGYVVFNLLNIAESKNLSKKLGAIKFTLMWMENERNTVKELVYIAQKNKVRKIIISGVQLRNDFENTFWKRIFYVDKCNYILKKIPDIDLVLINHCVRNPFGEEKYKNGDKKYLMKSEDDQTSYTLSDRPSGEKDIAGLFFQVKRIEERNGVFAFFHNGRVTYVQIQQGKTNIPNWIYWH